MDGEDVILEAWTPLDGKGEQLLYTARTEVSNILRLVPVVYVKRKM